MQLQIFLWATRHIVLQQFATAAASGVHFQGHISMIPKSHRIAAAVGSTREIGPLFGPSSSSRIPLLLQLVMDQFFKGRAGFFKSWGYNFLNRQVISTEVITMLFFTFWLIIFKLKPILAKTEEKYCSTLPSTQFLLLLIFCWISETRHLSVIKF